MTNQTENDRAAFNTHQGKVFDKSVGSFEQPIPADVLDRLQTIVDEAELKPGSSVLDVGTGTGVLLPFILDKKPASITACDLSSRMLSRAKSSFGKKVTFFQLDVLDIPIGKSTLDSVFCNACFANFFDQKEAIRVISRLLVPGGRLIISHPMGRSFVQQLKQQSSELDLRDFPDSKLQAKQLLRSAGLKVVRFWDEPCLYLVVAIKDGQ